MKQKIEKLGFQTFYTSREDSNSPLLPEIIKTGKNLKKLGVESDTTISLRYGRRVLINAENTSLEKIGRSDLIEIVDYDPVKNVLLAIGPKESKIDSSTHWMIHHARNEINAVVQINDSSLAEKLSNSIPTTDKEYPIGSLEFIKEVLKTLKDGEKIVIRNRGVLFTGSSIKEVENMVLETYRG